VRQIPNKLFGFLGSRNPIIAYVASEALGDAERILNQVGGHLIVSSSEIDGVVEFLKELILNPARREVARGRGDVLEELCTDRQMEILLRALKLAPVPPGRRDDLVISGTVRGNDQS
jgi:hypothetical protein